MVARDQLPKKRSRPFVCCLPLVGFIVIFALFWLSDDSATSLPFSNSRLLRYNASSSSSSSATDTQLNAAPTADTPFGPPLHLVRAAFAKFCVRATEHPRNLPCLARGGLRRIRPVLPAAVGPGMRTEPCGHGNVLARLHVGEAVRIAAPALFHLLDEYARLPPICTYPAHEDKWVSKSIQDSGIWDAPLATFIVRTLTQPHQGSGIVIDVGANVGSMSLLAGILGFRTFAFEASTRTAKMLARTIGMNRLESRVTVLNNALGNGLYYSRLIVPKDNRGGSALGLSNEEFGVNINEKAGPTEDEDHISVVCLDTMTDYLDVVLPAEGLSRVVTLLKIDVERFEPLVIRGGAEFFSRFDVRTIILEISSFGWSLIGCDVGAVVRAMLEIGYIMSTQDGYLVRNTADFKLWSDKIHLEKTQVNVVFTRKQHILL